MRVVRGGGKARGEKLRTVGTSIPVRTQKERVTTSHKEQSSFLSGEGAEDRR